MARLVSGRVVAALAVGAAGGWAASYMWWAAGGKGMRPAMKEAIKAGLTAFERGWQTAAEWSETVSDLVAEADAERRQAAPAALDGPFGDEAGDVGAASK